MVLIVNAWTITTLHYSRKGTYTETSDPSFVGYYARTMNIPFVVTKLVCDSEGELSSWSIIVIVRKMTVNRWSYFYDIFSQLQMIVESCSLALLIWHERQMKKSCCRLMLGRRSRRLCRFPLRWAFWTVFFIQSRDDGIFAPYFNIYVVVHVS